MSPLGSVRAPVQTSQRGTSAATALWDAAPLLDTKAATGTRQIITVANGVGIAFTSANWDQLTDDEKRGLLGGGLDPSTATADQINEAKARIDYLRGRADL